MNLDTISEKIENSQTATAIREFIGSKFFPVVTALVILICYYLGWDVVTIWYLGFVATAMFITCRDLTPVLALFLFMHIIISFKNSPSPLGEKSDYFLRPEILGQIIAVISVAVIALVARVGYNIATKAFKPSPMLFGICAFSAALLLNGAFSSEYDPLNLLYGVFLSTMFIGVFMLLTSNVEITDTTFEKIAFYFICLFVVLALELFVAYMTYDGLIVDGKVIRSKLFFGWGMYNNMGMLFCVCTPASFYLAIRKRHGWIYTIVGLLNVAVTFFTMSRQSMIGAAVAGIACVIWLLCSVKGIERSINAVLIALAAVVVLACILGMWDEFIMYFNSVGDNFETGSGRLILWERAFKNFLDYPVFGVGFFGGNIDDLDPGFAGLEIIPRMYHNTFMQMLGGCGIVGLIAYIVHRLQTIWSFIKNITRERIFLAIILGVFLTVCLLDNHIFYLFPTLMYTALVALLYASEKTGKIGDGKTKATK